MRNPAAPSMRPTLMALALSLAFNHASAQEDGANPEEVRKDLATPDSTISLGIGLLGGDSRRYGQFRGLNSDGTYGVLDLNLIRRNDETGTWLKLRGRNLGLETRELRFDHERQGNWGYFLESSRLVRNEPWIVNSGLQGIDTSRQTVSAAAPKGNLDLQLSHEMLTAGVRKFINGGFEIRASFKQDEKRGNRMYGETGMLFLTEPMDRTTRQWEIVAGYADKTLQLSGGYSGSSFENRIPVLNVAGTAPVPAFTQLALPPSNHSHQLHLSGGYNFDSTTRSSFKISRSIAIQDSVFPIATVQGSLDGRMVTTLGYADLSLRPADRLDVHASLRYEDRDDQTPVAKYLTAAPPTTLASGALFTAGVSGFNKPPSLKQLKGTVEAGYQLDEMYRVVASLEHERTRRSIPEPYRRVAFRATNDETQGRIELKRALSETLNGAIAYIRSERGGSDYVDDTYGQNPAGVVVVVGAPTNQLNPLIWADRKRDKLRLTADWIPDEDWSLQFIGDVSADRYSGRNLGPRKGNAMLATADATYALSDKWKLSGWVTQERTLAQQTTHTDYSVAAPNGGILWEAKILNITTAWGLGIKGKPREYLELGADLSSSTDTAEHGMSRLGNIGTCGTCAGTASPTSLPEYYYRLLSLKLFADYALDRYSGIRAMVNYDRRRTNDWTWAGFTYTPDGTTVSQPNQQDTTFIGAAYHYRFR